MAYFLNDFSTMSSLMFFQLLGINYKLLVGCQTFHECCFLFAPLVHACSIDTTLVRSCLAVVVFSELIGKHHNNRKLKLTLSLSIQSTRSRQQWYEEVKLHFVPVVPCGVVIQSCRHFHLIGSLFTLENCVAP